ncbi:hypothetical protein CPB84DRAFT_1789763 [Gymnopilus junonius]|uniref:Uncharacterized protein n=1 Tax=Gymnopilus junonius TaxID=109634 RepID=A0A9P5NHF4_GYMJU|nr:hypothetical protein CPB84DRAFT_1789763 [Gymnopilus junonius]
MQQSDVSYPSPPELSGGVDNRIDSGETVDSPFSSNLVTPADEDPYYNRGIHERLTLANNIGEYFNTTANDTSFKDTTSNIVKSSEHLLPELEGDEIAKIRETAIHLDSEPELKEAHSLGSLNSLSTPPSSFSSSASFRRARSESIYNLPNDHIFIDEPPVYLSLQQNDKGTFDMVSSYQQDYDVEFNSLNSLTVAISEVLLGYLLLGFRVLFFLPWCIAVGGALIFFPDYLDMLAFRTGYLEPVTAIRRFSHWATYGFQHVVSFFCFLGALLWHYPSVGFSVTILLVCQFCLVWHGFLFDATTPLGEDVRQTTYLLFTTTWLDSDDLVNIKKVDGAYYWADKFIPDESDPDLD